MLMPYLFSCNNIVVILTVTEAKVPVSIRQLLQMFSDGDLPEEKRNTVRTLV